MPHDDNDLQGLNGNGSKYPTMEALDFLLFYLRRQKIPADQRNNQDRSQGEDDSRGNEPLAPRARAPRAGVSERGRVPGFAIRHSRHAHTLRDNNNIRRPPFQTRWEAPGSISFSNGESKRVWSEILLTHMVPCTLGDRSRLRPILPRCKHPHCSTPGCCRFGS